MMGTLRLFSFSFGWLFAACSFTPSGLEAENDGSPVSGVDASTPADAAAQVDAGPCAATTAAVEVGSQQLINGQTSALETVLIGDTLTLSAADSCVTRGPISYSWSIGGPANLGGTAAPDVNAHTITVYPTRSGSYTVSLTVTGSAQSATLSGVAFVAAGWVGLDRFPPSGATAVDVRGLSTSPDTLWVASAQGAYRVPLTAPETGEFVLVNPSAGVAMPADPGAVFYDGSQNSVWFSNNEDDSNVYRINLAVTPATGDVFSHDLSTGKIDDIAALEGGGILVGGSTGVSLLAGSTGFVSHTTQEAEAVASSAGTPWAGENALVDLGATDAAGDDTSHDIFVGNDEIEDILPIGSELWIAGRPGVARFAPVSSAVTAQYSLGTMGLPGAKIRALAVDSAGDIWAATDRGLARFKQDRGLWVALQGRDGLQGRDDLRTIAIDESGGRRAIYVGGSTGLTISHVPSIQAR